VFDQSFPFEGRLVSGKTSDVVLRPADVRSILARAQKLAPITRFRPPVADEEERLLREIRAGTSTVIADAKRCLDALRKAKAEGTPFTGPDEALLEGVVKGGIAALPKVRGIEFRVHVAWLRVVAERPGVGLGVPTTTLSGVRVQVSTTLELWWHHPVLHCSHLCTQWSISWAWSRLLSVTIHGLRLAADAHADVSAHGTEVQVRAAFDRLRFDYPVLGLIPLEGIANAILGNKPVLVFDAGKYLATLPVLESKFAVSDLALPPGAGRIEADITIRSV
jgi:hypothetical protein